MKSTTVSMRLSEAEIRKLEQQAQQMGIERPVFLKRALRRGAQELMFDCACELYRRGEATLSRAAELAGLSLRDMILRLEGADLELSYGTEELAKDLDQ